MQFFIVCGSPYTLQYLRELGFKTFSPFIDESYDEIVNPTERMKKILSEINRISSMNEKDLTDLYYKLFEIIKFNYIFLIKQMPSSFKAGIEKKFLSRLKLLTNTELNTPNKFERVKKYFKIKQKK
jgi:hypothetical protein